MKQHTKKLKELMKREIRNLMETLASNPTLVTEDCNILATNGEGVPDHIVQCVKVFLECEESLRCALIDDNNTLVAQCPTDPLVGYIWKLARYSMKVSPSNYAIVDNIGFDLAVGVERHFGVYVPFYLIMGDDENYSKIVKLLDTFARKICKELGSQVIEYSYHDSYFPSNNHDNTLYPSP